MSGAQTARWPQRDLQHRRRGFNEFPWLWQLREEWWVEDQVIVIRDPAKLREFLESPPTPRADLNARDLKQGAGVHETPKFIHTWDTALHWANGQWTGLLRLTPESVDVSWAGVILHKMTNPATAALHIARVGTTRMKSTGFRDPHPSSDYVIIYAPEAGAGCLDKRLMHECWDRTWKQETKQK